MIVDNVSGASGLTYMNPAAVLYKYDIRDETLHEVLALKAKRSHSSGCTDRRQRITAEPVI